ncbi:MAG TPA: ABC transporter ATP-binding protein [Micromonosporaceae bacterium]|nr:ABC transporter ATP-binding protein [Micromonosporaceae bacterium]
MTAALEINSLVMRFGGVTAVDGLTLRHDSGGVIGLIGPNGAGKTTVLNLLSGALRPTSGTVTLDGRRLDGRKPDRIARLGVARTFQNLQTFTSLTVRENVQVPLSAQAATRPLTGLVALLSRRDATVHRERADQLLADVGLLDLADQPASSLPYGLQRRLEVARALAANPRLLLLDEPLAGLSRAETGDLTTLFTQVAARGVTVLLVEHDVASVLAVSRRVIVLDHGALLADGPPDQVAANPAVRAAYLGEEHG